MRYITRILTLLVVGVSLALTSSGLGQIAIQDGPSPIEYNTAAANNPAPLNSAPFTVTPGATTLVVMLGLRSQGASPAPGSDPGAPATITWNGITLTKAVSKGSTASTWDDNAIYYLMNPPAATGSMSATLNTNYSQCWWMAYTLNGVNTSVAPLTTSANLTPAAGPDYITNSLTLNAGVWVAVAGSASIGTHNTFTLSVLPSVGLPLNVALPNIDMADGNADMFFGSVSNCFAGSSKLLLLSAQNSNPKMVMVSAVFTPAVTAPAAPSLSAIQPVGQPAQAQLSWSESAGSVVSYYFLMRSTNSTGPFTDYTNLVSNTTTSFTDSNVVSGRTYYYALAAVNAVSTNLSSIATLTPNGPPFAPVLGVGAWGSNRLALHWTGFGATNYIVASSTTSGGETPLASVTGNAYTNSGLTAGTTYYYKVQAVGPGGTSASSAEASGVALGTSWYLFDNFSLDTVSAALNGQSGSAGLGQGWTNLGGGTPIAVATGSPFGANYAQYAAGSIAGIGDYEAGLGIASNSSVATVFLEFSLPGIQPPSAAGANQTGANIVAMNFDIDNSSPPGALTGQSTTGPSAQFNYDNSTGDGYFRVLGGNTFYFVTLGPSSTPYAPIPGDLYYFWFVINAAKETYQIYLANGSETGTNLDSGGLGAAPTLMWGAATDTGVGTVTTYGFRNATASPAPPVGPVNYIGTGPGSQLGTVAQNEFGAIYVDQGASDLVNPVTGQPPTGAFVLEQPQSVQVYAGGTASFTVVASAGVTGYQWQTNGVNIGNGPNVSGATTSTLVISNVSAANALNYSCVIFNPSSASIGQSQPATLTIVNPVGAYETAARAAGPAHYYAFNDTNNPAASTPTIPSLAYDFAGSDNGVYGANALNGGSTTPVYGPDVTNGFPGFAANNYAVQISGNEEPNGVTMDSPWNLDTNTVTITAWINPNTSTEPQLSSIVLNRGTGTDVEGLIFGSNSSGIYNLGYEWNADPNTYSWVSGLQAPANQWSFVSLVVTPTNATINLMNTNGLLSSTFTYPNPVAPFAGTTMIGDDPGTPSGALAFNGGIDEVGIYSQALSEIQLQTMFFDASGLVAADFPPTNSVQLDTLGTIYPAMSAQFSALAGGAAPLTNYWQIILPSGATNNLTDGPSSIGTIIGSGTTSLTISNLAPATSGQYYYLALITANASGSYTSSPAAVLAVAAVSPPTTITTTEIEAAGNDWNTAGSWSDGEGVSLSVYSAPGSTYEIVPGTMERTPLVTNAVFQGDVLVIAGSGVLVDGNGATFGATDGTGELRMKQSGTTTGTNYGIPYNVGGTITFPDLQLTGGQIDNGANSGTVGGGTVILYGEIDVLSNSAIYADSAATQPRSVQISSYLTGSGTLTYTYLGPAAEYPYNALIVSCPTNIFTGQWNIGNGGLLGNAPNSLGTNSITIGPNGMLETTYNLNSPNASLTLNGQMYLYTADTFKSVTINGIGLNAGTYTFAQLNAAYPANFPTTWPVQLGSSTGTNTGAGSITVLTSSAPLSPANILTTTIAGGNLTMTGTNGTPNASYHVLTSTNVALPFSRWTVLTSGSFNAGGGFSVTVPITTANNQQFYLLRSP